MSLTRFELDVLLYLEDQNFFVSASDVASKLGEKVKKVRLACDGLVKKEWAVKSYGGLYKRNWDRW